MQFPYMFILCILTFNRILVILDKNSHFHHRLALQSFPVQVQVQVEDEHGHEHEHSKLGGSHRRDD